MPLVKAPVAPQAAAPAGDAGALLERLSGADATDRRYAAKALAGDPASAEALASRLACEPEQSVRTALFGSLVAIGGPAVAHLLAGLLRSPDTDLRNGAVSGLQGLAAAATTAEVDRLLMDPNSRVRILAIEVMRAWSHEDAATRLQRVMGRDTHLGVCGAAVDVVAELGTSDLLPALADLRTRCAANAFMAFAIDVASARIQASGGGEPG